MLTVSADCGIPEAPKNGRVNFNGTEEGSIANYIMRCNKGCIVGEIYRICESSGQWSGYIPECHCELLLRTFNVLL